ncbi:MAG: hypothetical protein HOH33_12060 [Verrucomicrobia bacterium]|jgi:uncharacterized membrane protein|nr:hypothetical protein [Verrucomicrobiota bacterium]
MELPGQIIVSSPEWLPALLGGFAVFLLILAWTYSGTGIPMGRRFICVLLKAFAVALLILCLLEPQWTQQKPEAGANYYAVLADNSQSMTIFDPGLNRTRGEEATGLLVTDPGLWRDTLDDMFQVRRYGMDSRLHGLKDFSELTFDGGASGLGSALGQLGSRFRDQPLAGMLLVSDGNATDANLDQLDLAELPPVYPVVIGSDQSSRDVSISNMAVSQTAFEDAPVTLRADVAVLGFAGREVEARLFEADFSKKPVSPATNESSELDLAIPSQTPLESIVKGVSSEQETLSYRFQFRPEKPGVSFYRLEVSVVSDGLAGDASTEEAAMANNKRLAVVDRDSEPHRILYVAGRPNWEYKFLNRSLAEDDQVQLVGLIRIAKKAPKFEFKGRQGETSNPLYRGFDKKDEFTEQLDQAVFTRLNIKDESELIGGFPKRVEDLFGYSAIILDDLESGYFTRDQMSLVQKFVSERGGGLMMLGGYESLTRGEYDDTPIGRMLPVYLDSGRGLQGVQGVSLELTREGWLQPWIRLRSTESLEHERLESMPEFQVINLVTEVKPGASVLMQAKSPYSGETYPALVSQRYGSGRSMVMAVGDLWRWQMHDKTDSGDLGKAWRQMIRGLIADVPSRIDIDLQREHTTAGSAMRIQVGVKDGKYWPVDNANVRLTVKTLTAEDTVDAAGNAQPSDMQSTEVQLNAEPSIKEPGVYQAVYVPRLEGGYHLGVEVTDANGVVVAREEAGWTNDPSAEEFQSLVPNRAWMDAVAQKTGGRVLKRSELDSWAEDLQFDAAPIMETISTPIWHTPYLFIASLGLFALEWYLRRKRGLA